MQNIYMVSPEHTHPLRDRFPQLSDEEFDRVLKREEAMVAISRYIRQRVLTELDPYEERKYEYYPHFPFPIGRIAYEIADVVLDSFGSFETELQARAAQDSKGVTNE